MKKKAGNMERLENAIKEMRELAKEFKKKNGNTSLRIPNKDFNLWMVQKLLDQDGRITRIEARQRVTLIFIPIIIGIVALCYQVF